MLSIVYLVAIAAEAMSGAPAAGRRRMEVALRMLAIWRLPTFPHRAARD